MHALRTLARALPRAQRCALYNATQFARYAHVGKAYDVERNHDAPSVEFRKKRFARSARELNEERSLKLDGEDANDFGNLGPNEVLSAEYLPDDDDGYDKMEKMKRLKPMRTYEIRMANLLHGRMPHKVKRAIELFEEMQRENRMVPPKNFYTMLIMGCSHFGLTNEAFELYREERKLHKYTPTKATVTSLYNCCANSRDVEFGLEKARELREQLHEEGYVYNNIQYHAMIKAFGKLGDMKTAFHLVKEMVQNKHSITSDTYSMLLVGCISDKEAGYTHAVRILRQMKRRRIPFTLHTFNLFFRCIRECDVGTKDHLRHLFHEWNEASKIKSSDLTKNFQIAEPRNSSGKDVSTSLPSRVGQNECEIATEDKAVTKETDIEKRLIIPNLMSPLTSKQKDHMVGFDFDCLKLAENRLMLVGGLDGMFSMMKEAKVQPTMATATLLMDSIPKTIEAEAALLENLKRLNVKLDTDFFNMLIKRRCFRYDMKSAREAIVQMQSHGLLVDIVTFGVLATGCRFKEQGLQLIRDTEIAGFSLNEAILGALVRQACIRFDFEYLTLVLETFEAKNVKPSPRQLETIELTKTKVDNVLWKFEKGKLSELPKPFDNESFDIIFDKFKQWYQMWLKRIEIEMPGDPMEQYEFTRTPRPKAAYDEFEKEIKELIEKRFEKELKAAQLEMKDLPQLSV
ncbi:Pentatricopeptide repeat-containing protein 1, mitochondrial [Halotydeus destructor]|nr:Pentatricopeptide repeat-containing protein 1, mitochondrial [Halotydeus destructor]